MTRLTSDAALCHTAFGALRSAYTVLIKYHVGKLIRWGPLLSADVTNWMTSETVDEFQANGTLHTHTRAQDKHLRLSAGRRMPVARAVRRGS